MKITWLAMAIIIAMVFAYSGAIKFNDQGGDRAIMYKNSRLVGTIPVATFWGHVDDLSVCKMAGEYLNETQNNGSPGLYHCERAVGMELIW